MKNWKLNYYKNLEKFVKFKIKQLESDGHKSDDNPLEVFLSRSEEKIKENFNYENPLVWKPKHKELNFDSGYLRFDNLLRHIGRLQSVIVFDEGEPMVRSYMYSQRQPRPSKVKELIKKTNGSLIYESFFNEIDQPRHSFFKTKNIE